MRALSRARLRQIATMEQPVVTLKEARRMAREVDQLREEFVTSKVNGYHEGVADAIAIIKAEELIETLPCPLPYLRKRIALELIDEVPLRYS